MEAGFSDAALEEATRALYEAIDSLNDALLQRAAAEGQPAACRRGCSWCCHQAVFGVSHEFVYLRNWLERNLDPKVLEGITKRAGAKQAVTEKLSATARLQHKAPCPLLENGACMAYSARPMACRIYLSSDEGSCREEYRHPENTKTFPALFSFPLQAGRMMNEGFSSCLRELGFKNEEQPLETGLSSLML
ncbi:MAG: YkgJ family cysteine cluster protein [Bacteroidota bacterium]